MQLCSGITKPIIGLKVLDYLLLMLINFPPHRDRGAIFGLRGPNNELPIGE